MTRSTSDSEATDPAEPLAQDVRTRDCADPWTMVFVHGDRQVSLCCWSPAIGSLDDAPLATLVQGDASRRFRAGLLSGVLPDACRRCPARGWTTVGELTGAVSRIQAADPANDLEDLRRRVRLHCLEREELTSHLEQLLRHCATIEERNRHLQRHAANLERILRRTGALPVYRLLCRIKDSLVRSEPRDSDSMEPRGS